LSDSAAEEGPQQIGFPFRVTLQVRFNEFDEDSFKSKMALELGLTTDEIVILSQIPIDSNSIILSFQFVGATALNKSLEFLDMLQRQDPFIAQMKISQPPQQPYVIKSRGRSKYTGEPQDFMEDSITTV
jgi:hypothetical protein